MSSLASLLNPSPEANDHEQSSSTSGPRKDSLPPISYVQSPEQTHAPTARQGNTYPISTDQDVIQGLTALAGSPPAPNTSQWYAQQGDERRPGSSGMQLPMPSADSRRMSSPTLQAYHMSSRSPELGRAPSVHGMTLPPLQNMNSGPNEEGSNPASGTQVGIQDSTNNIGSSQLHPDAASLPPLKEQTTTTAADQMGGSSPAALKQEQAPSPPLTSTEGRRNSTQQDMEGQTNKAIASLKSEHSALTQSPLRESSVPIPTTELAGPEVANPKKRPAPTKKKGTAMATKKAPPAKKRKVEVKRSATPSSIGPKTAASKLVGGKGTPANSSPAPSARSQSADPNDEPDDDDEEMEDPDIDDNEMYCLCRKPDTGTFMIGCDGTCDDWFHGKCVGIEEKDKNLIDKYICPNCKEAGIGKTTWKRICRRLGCRMPARISRSKSSKYCSDECGVKFWRETMDLLRGSQEAAKNRANRRKTSIIGHEQPPPSDGLGARGGILSAGELKALVNSSKSAEDFKKLGEGVLSPPATPDSKKDPSSRQDEILTEFEAAALQEISRKKDAAREKHQLLKDRMKFVTMVKQAASRAATEKELKPKEYCGYDPRLEWTDVQFSRWRNSTAGKQAFELDSLDPGYNADDEEEAEELDVCERKKCARHLEWNKLAVDDVRANMSDNGNWMRQLDAEEKETRERAALRAKAGSLMGEGSVELHEPAAAVLAAVEGEAAKGLGISDVADGVGVEGTTGEEAVVPPETDRPVEQAAVVENVEGVDAAAA